MKNFLIGLMILSTGAGMASGFDCRATCESPWGVKNMRKMGGDIYFTQNDVFIMMEDACPGRLVESYQRDPYRPWRARAVEATPETSCVRSSLVPSSFAPDYEGNGIGY